MANYMQKTVLQKQSPDPLWPTTSPVPSSSKLASCEIEISVMDLMDYGAEENSSQSITVTLSI